MSNAINAQLSVVLHSNGLCLITLLDGQGRHRRVVCRTHLTYDVSEGIPAHWRVLQDATDKVAATLRRA